MQDPKQAALTSQAEQGRENLLELERRIIGEGAVAFSEWMQTTCTDLAGRS